MNGCLVDLPNGAIFKPVHLRTFVPECDAAKTYHLKLPFKLQIHIKSPLCCQYFAEACSECVASLLGLVPEQHSSQETSQRCSKVADTVSDFTGLSNQNLPRQ